MREGTDRPFVNPMLIVVSPEHTSQYAYLKHTFEKDAIELVFDRRVFDRRVGERRQLTATDRARSERRRGRERRQRDITKDLEMFGWAIVRRWEK